MPVTFIHFSRDLISAAKIKSALGILLFNSLLLFNSALWAIGTENLLRAEEAFKVSAKVLAANKLEITWSISDGYYLYRDKIKITSKSPEITLDQFTFPEGQLKHDDNFGDMVVYHHNVSVQIPLIQHGDSENFSVQIQYQGCAEAGVCYPPQKNTFDLTLPKLNATDNANPLAFLSKSSNKAHTDDDLLSADQAFQFFAEVKDATTLKVHWNIAEGYYLYREKIQLYLREAQNIKLGKFELPHGKPQHDEAFGDVEIFTHELAFDVPLERQSSAVTPVKIQAEFQGCAERGVCYPPMQKMLELSLPAADTALLSKSTATTKMAAVSEQDQIIQSLNQDSLGITLLTFFGFGLLLAFTPCIFPMIPILSGIIVGKGHQVNTLTAFLLSLAYVVASALTYTVFGIIAALFGNNLQATFQQPWIIALFSAIFIALSLSMFGFYHLELPKAFQAKIHDSSEKFRNHSYWGAAMMGALSSLIVGPCVAAPLAGALIYIGQTGDALLGGSALFAMGIGMGVPLLILGASAGKLLPKAGHWLNATKAVFGVIMLAVAVWMLARIIPQPITMLLWSMLCIIPAMYLKALDSLPDNCSNWSRLWKGLGILMLIYGILLLVGLSAGNTNPLKPLQGLSSTKSTANNPSLAFEKIHSIQELETLLAAASSQNQILMLDYYADWCISCQEMESYTFADPQVKQRIKNMRLVQADVTDNSPDEQALLKHFNLVGPPATLFFGKDQQELTQYRVIGFKDAQSFINDLAGLPQ